MEPVTATGARRKPTIAIVVWKLGPRGHPAGELARVLPLLRDHADFVVVSSHVDREVRPLVRWLRAPAPQTWGRLAWAVFFVAASIRLRRVRADLVHAIAPRPIVRGRVDLVSVVYSDSVYHASLDGRRPYGPPVLWRVIRRFTLALERASYRPGRVRALAAKCASGKRTLERHFPGLDVVVVPNSIDSERFRPRAAVRAGVRRAAGVGPDDTVAIFVGRYWELKGLGVAIEGLAEAVRGGAHGLRLWVLGEGNTRRYETLAERAGVGGAVRFLGFRDDVERFYQAADVFVLPTVCETFCRAAYEAAACRLPVVATRVDGVTDLVADGRCGLLVDRDAASVGSALARLAADPELRRRLGSEGRRRSTAFTPERSAAALLAA
jgi:glycosyltransferase involved in cell wall biosynthesis